MAKYPLSEDHLDSHFLKKWGMWFDWGTLWIGSILLLWQAWLQGQWPGTGVDLYGTVWFYGWIYHSLTQWFDPSFTEWFFFPNGKDIFAHTGNNFVDAYLSIPFQMVFKDWYPAPFVTSLLLMNVWCFRWWVEELGALKWVQCWMGWLWLLNPFCLSELAMGRPTQLLLFPSMVALIFFMRLEDGDRKAWWWLGLFVAFQGWCYWFYGFFLAMVMGGLLFLRIIHGKSTPVYLFDLLKAGILCAVLIAPAVGPMLQTVDSNVGLGTVDTSSLLSIRQTMVPWIRSVQLFEPIGHPMFFSWLYGSMLLGVLWSIRKGGRWLVVALGMSVVALGPFQTIGDTELLNYPYLFLVKLIPFFERLWFPYRAIGFVMMLVLVQLALLAKEWRGSLRIKGMLVGGSIMLGGWDLYRVSSLPLVHTEMPKSSVSDCIDAPTIQLPIGFVHPTMVWQVEHQQPYFGGMGENGLLFLPQGYKARLQNPWVQFLRSASLWRETTKRYSPFDKQRILDLGFRYVLWDRSMTEQERLRYSKEEGRPTEIFLMQQTLIEHLGYPICHDGAWLLFDIQSPLDTLEQPLDGWDWQPQTLSNYEIRLREMGRVPKQ